MTRPDSGRVCGVSAIRLVRGRLPVRNPRSRHRPRINLNGTGRIMRSPRLVLMTPSPRPGPRNSVAAAVGGQGVCAGLATVATRRNRAHQDTTQGQTIMTRYIWCRRTPDANPDESPQPREKPLNTSRPSVDQRPTRPARNLHRPLNRIRRHRTFRHHVTVNSQPLLAHRKIHIPAGTRRVPPQRIRTRLRHTRPHPLRNLIRRPPHTVSDINDRCTFRRSYGLGFRYRLRLRIDPP